MKRVLFLSVFLLFVLIACKNEDEVLIPFNNSAIEYWGRIDTTSTNSATLFWSGTSIKFNFEGQYLDALMQDETGDNYYNIIIDHDSIVLLRPGKKKQYYRLASQLPEGEHTVEIFKRTEWDRGKTTFFGFKTNTDAKIIAKSAPKKRKIEFYGNSITAGYAVEDTTGGDSPDSTYTNNYLSYASITARHFDAEYQCICKSGIGITISWFPMIMPEIYNLIDPNDKSSKWDFSLFTPDVVVVNLFQNDSWLVNRPDMPAFKKNFGSKAPSDEALIKAYQNFAVGLRKHYPEAKIICALGSMDATKEGSKWPGLIEQAVINLNDQHIYTHFIPYKNTPGHPSIKEQEDMAHSLIDFIDENITW